MELRDGEKHFGLGSVEYHFGLIRGEHYFELGSGDFYSVAIAMNVLKISFISYQNEAFSTYSK